MHTSMCEFRILELKSISIRTLFFFLSLVFNLEMFQVTVFSAPSGTKITLFIKVVMVDKAGMKQIFLSMVKENMALEFIFFNTMIYENVSFIEKAVM